MKRLTKKANAQFCELAKALLLRLGFQPYPVDEPGYDYHANDLRIMTDLGTYCVHVPDMLGQDHHSHCIYGRFETRPPRDDYRSELRLRFNSLDANPYSGKWNLMGTCDAGQTLLEFQRRMGWVNARPPTPEEVAQWALDDAASAAKLSAERADWRAHLAAEEAKKTDPRTLSFVCDGKPYLVNRQGHIKANGLAGFSDSWVFLGGSHPKADHVEVDLAMAFENPSSLDGLVGWDVDHGTTRLWAGRQIRRIFVLPQPPNLPRHV